MIQKEFPICVYGNVEKYNDVLSKARARVFYKYENRNGTYISDEFAEKLLKSISYAPVKGIYEDGDYTDHGASRTEGRIYGIVPEEPNIAWEAHMDEDGVEREYACVDVLLFSAIYPEADQIVGKSLSMELFEGNLQYHFGMIKGQKYAIFDEGSFLGLQVLGDQVEPCFEGASFFTLQKTIEDAIEKIKEYSKKGGKSGMLKFKLSDDQKFSALWNLLNTEYNEEGEWTVSYGIVAVYDDYALVTRYEDGAYERVYYTKDDEKDMLELTERESVYIMDVTEGEKNTLDVLRKLNGDTYELVQDNLSNADKNAEDCKNYELKIEELNSTISTLNTEVSESNEKLDNAATEYAAAQETINSLTEEVNGLKAYKHSIETQQKEAVISEYSGKLSEDVLDVYRDDLDKYSVLELDKELAYALKKSNASIFTSNTPAFVPKEQEEGGIESILSRYNKK